MLFEQYPILNRETRNAQFLFTYKTVSVRLYGYLMSIIVNTRKVVKKKNVLVFNFDGDF